MSVASIPPCLLNVFPGGFSIRSDFTDALFVDLGSHFYGPGSKGTRGPTVDWPIGLGASEGSERRLKNL